MKKQKIVSPGPGTAIVVPTDRALGKSEVLEAMQKMAEEEHPGEITLEVLKKEFSETAIEQIAMVCHDAIAAYCRSVGDHSQKNWVNTEVWEREATKNAVRIIILDDSDIPDRKNTKEYLFKAIVNALK